MVITQMQKNQVKCQLVQRLEWKETDGHWSYDLMALYNTHTYTHTHPFNGPLSGTTWLSRYQKSKTNLDFTEARDSEWQWNPLGHMQICTSHQTDNTPAPHRSVFYRPDALPAAQPTVSKHWRQQYGAIQIGLLLLLLFIDHITFPTNAVGKYSWARDLVEYDK